MGGLAPALQSKQGPGSSHLGTGAGASGWRILLTAPYATIVWDYIHRGMPLGHEGTLDPR